MPRFKTTDEQDDLSAALGLLRGLVEFAEMQGKAGLIDGACDPALYVDVAKDLLNKYGADASDTQYALEA